MPNGMNMNNFEDEQISKLYREYIKDELTSPEVLREKDRFIKQNFGASSRFDLRPTVFIPAMSLCLVAALIFLVMPQNAMKPLKTVVKSVEEVTETVALPTYKEALEMSFEDEPVWKRGEQQVEVTRLTSQVGDTMFYQSVEKEVPVTVVWVFPRVGEGVMVS